MPLNDFFTYQIINQDISVITVRVSIDGDHSLYKGHFPGQPVTPGVVMIEILRQVLSASLDKKLFLTSAKEIKYLNPVIPNINNQIDYQIEYHKNESTVSVNCVISWQEKVFTKIKGEFREE